MIEILLRYRAQQNYLLHSFVVMPDHIHALLTPAESVERAVGLIKGGFSFAIRGEASGAIWQNGYHEHRIRDLGDYQSQHLYIERNPIRRGYADYPYTHTSFAEHLDGTPCHLG